MQEVKKVHDMTVLVKKTTNQLHETQQVRDSLVRLHVETGTQEIVPLQALKGKVGGHEKDEYRIRRLEEEKSILKKRVERAKKSELIGSADAVLLEEIKELRVSVWA